MSATLLVPRWVAQNARRERMIDATLDAVPYWNRLLRQIDDRLSLVWVHEDARAPGLVPARWHIRRRNDPPAPDSYMPIMLPDGGYRPMASDILDELRSRDLWRDDVARQRMEARFEEEARQAEKREQADREETVDELAGRIKAKLSPGVLITKGIEKGTG